MYEIRVNPVAPRLPKGSGKQGMATKEATKIKEEILQRKKQIKDSLNTPPVVWDTSSTRKC